MNLNVKESSVIKTHQKIINVIDGDGLIVSNLFSREEEEIRLLGIDAPELRKCRKLNQDERETHVAGQLLMMLGRMSHKFLLGIAPPETNVTLVMEKDNHIDAYGRTLAYVYLSDGRCLNEVMISNGYAKPYTLLHSNELINYRKLNNVAKRDKIGLYSIVKRF